MLGVFFTGASRATGHRLVNPATLLLLPLPLLLRDDTAQSDGETVFHDVHSVDKNDHFWLGFNSQQGGPAQANR